MKKIKRLLVLFMGVLCYGAPSNSFSELQTFAVATLPVCFLTTAASTFIFNLSYKAECKLADKRLSFKEYLKNIFSEDKKISQGNPIRRLRVWVFICFGLALVVSFTEVAAFDCLYDRLVQVESKHRSLRKIKKEYNITARDLELLRDLNDLFENHLTIRFEALEAGNPLPERFYREFNEALNLQNKAMDTWLKTRGRGV
ncbi:hypothetical protein ACFLY6_00040 [Candidatus Dependentiae bacterium]